MYKNYIYIIVLLALLSGACEKIIDFDEETKTSKLVVNSMFNPDTNLSIYISESLTIIDRDLLGTVDNATVKLFEDGEYAGDLQFSQNGKYEFNENPKSNKNYSVEIKAPGFISVSSQSTIPKNSVEILSVDTATVNLFDEHRLKFIITLEDTGDEFHYYGLKLIGLSLDYADQIYFYSNDPILNTGNNDVRSAAFTNELFTNTTTDIEVITNIYGYDIEYYYEKVIIVIETYSEDAYLYNRSYQQYQIALDDFFAEPVQVYNNIENGFGIFGGYRILDYPFDLQ